MSVSLRTSFNTASAAVGVPLVSKTRTPPFGDDHDRVPVEAHVSIRWRDEQVNAFSHVDPPGWFVKLSVQGICEKEQPQEGMADPGLHQVSY